MIVMIGTPLFTNPIAPGALGAYAWNSEGYYRQEVILRNQKAIDRRIARMNLKIQKLTAIDTKGEEHLMLEFPWNPTLKIKGAQTGWFVRTMGHVKLTPGKYLKLRFYFNPFKSSMQDEENTHIQLNLNYLDFDLNEPLLITNGNPPELIIKFNLLSRKGSFHLFRYKLKTFFNQKLSGIPNRFIPSQNI